MILISCTEQIIIRTETKIVLDHKRYKCNFLFADKILSQVFLISNRVGVTSEEMIINGAGISRTKIQGGFIFLRRKQPNSLFWLNPSEKNFCDDFTLEQEKKSSTL